ncbi:MAG: ComEC/Rec2 family competence protein [Alphaproteobacteria bacterium]|nr:ComEC/Rec2 family competence protein [Alphaproteobacteria bacterium]
MFWFLKKTLLRINNYLKENFEQESESLIIWYAVSFALGAAFYFALPQELSTWIIVTYLELVLILLYVYRNNTSPFKILTYVLLFMLGLCIAKADALYTLKRQEINLNKTTYLNGKIKVLDYNYRGKPRILLTDVNNYENKLKGYFKISLLKKEPWMEENKCVELIAELPKDFTPNPIGNYNQEKYNFYKNISAIGYAISPIFEKDCPKEQNSFSQIINQIRNSIKNKVILQAKPENSSIITALIIGDRSLITKEQNKNYRTSGLAHFLSISGMHMSIIALLVFFLIRTILLLFSNGQYDLRKPASVVAILATLLYFFISGQTVSCIRAFVMTTMILLAILLNRRAITLRLWAFSLMIVIIFSPESVTSPGFLMSFSATLGLIAFYEQKSSQIHNWLDNQSLIAKFATYILGVVITDLIASLMTLPYTMYFFNQIAVYTTLGNMLATPVITFYAMPSLLLYMISLPLGLSAYVMPILENAISIINHIAVFVSGLPKASYGNDLIQMSQMGIFIITIGMLWLCIWKEKWRVLGVFFIIFGLSTLLFTPSKDFVFDNSGTTFAYKNNENKLELSLWRKNKFLSRMWLNTDKLPKTTHQDTSYIKCSKEKCIYRNRIEFGRGWVKFDNKNILLKNGGYIDLKSGVHYYKKEKNRLWNIRSK